jgi:hypothetical protein
VWFFDKGKVFDIATITTVALQDQGAGIIRELWPDYPSESAVVFTVSEPGCSAAVALVRATVADRIGTTPRRPAPKRAEPTMMDLNPFQQAELVRLGLARGRLGDENGNVKEARDRAAMVAEAAKAGTYTTSEDTTPGRKVDPAGVAGYTAGHGYKR